MKNKKIIFHYPGPFYEELDTGEKKRPAKLFEGFKALGYEVELVNGSRSQRKAKIKQLLRHINEFDFVYSENSNIPLGLCEDAGKHKFSFCPVDFKLFKHAKEHNVPFGVFYRDFYWLYDFFREQLGALKFFIASFFYRQELNCYKKYAKVIFVPSRSSGKLLPLDIDGPGFVPMPPAEEPHDVTSATGFDAGAKLHLLYIGSVEPRKYNLQKLFDIVSDLEIKLTLVARRGEWEKYRDTYKLPETLSYAEAQGAELAKYYQQANLALYYLDDSNPYAAIRLPLKLFESIGYAVPMLSFGKSEVSNFLRSNNCGWAVYSQDEAKTLLSGLAADPTPLREKHQTLLQLRKQHSWENRAGEIANILLK